MTVNWSFVLALLEKIGFAPKCISRIKWCISTTCFSIMVNGSPLGFFQISRGLEQGDSLSLYLFILVMKTLSRILIRAKE